MKEKDLIHIHDRLADRLYDRLWNRLADRLDDRLYDRLWYRLADRLADRLYYRLDECLWYRLADRLDDRLWNRLYINITKITQRNLDNFKKNTLKKLQQGDMIIRMIPSSLVDVSELNRVEGNVVIAGQNNHMVEGGIIYQAGNDPQHLIVVVESEGKFWHTANIKPHESIMVEKGTYYITPKVELDMFSDMKRPVVD